MIVSDSGDPQKPEKNVSRCCVEGEKVENFRKSQFFLEMRPRIKKVIDTKKMRFGVGNTGMGSYLRSRRSKVDFR